MFERILNRYWYGRKAAYSAQGPIFISYRHIGGFSSATELSWTLRSFGVPVWVDQAELPPGDFRKRLREALRGGLSGGVIIVTGDIHLSKVVRNVEVPGLLKLAKASAFSLVVANPITTEEGGTDYRAPDRLLQQGRTSFTEMKQYPLTDDSERYEIARTLAIERVKAFSHSQESTLVVGLATRAVPLQRVKEVHLPIRTEPPLAGQRRPHQAVWSRLQPSLAFLPALVELSGCNSVRVTGAAHLSVAFSVGVALPTTFPVHIEVADALGNVWKEENPPDFEDQLRFSVEAMPGNDSLAVFVDLVPGTAPSTAFDKHLTENEDRYVAELRQEWVSENEIPHQWGASVAKVVAEKIRSEAGRLGVTHISLFMRTPFTIAFLLGRKFNTFTVELYEWENGGGKDEYIPVARVGSGAGASPILEILDIVEA